MHRGDEALMALMGLNGEAGECIDYYKKVLYHGHQFDENELLRELGDALWYIAVAAHAFDCSLESVMEMNIEKLKKRYPNGWEPSRSQNRDSGDK
jgi:NTP pyrophosphatase (non-canonical NTP hydrolase)